MAKVAQVTGKGRGLEFHVDWESSDGVTSPELAATWCRMEVQVEGRYASAVEDQRTSSMRRGVYTSAYPLAEWVAEHWWLLRSHVRPSTVPRKSWAWANAQEQPWLQGHNLRAAGGGLPWPDLTIVPEGGVTRLVWNAGPGLSDQPVTFLTSGDSYITSNDVIDALGRFVDQVLVRLTETGLSETPLQQEWSLIAGSDVEESTFAEAVARLGQDPFDATEELADDIMSVAEALEADVLEELLDSADSSGLREAATWIQRASQVVRTVRRPSLSSPLEPLQAYAGARQPSTPWDLGYAAARAYREQLGLHSREVFPTDEYVGNTSLEAPSAGVQGVVIVDDGAVGLVLPAWMGGGDTSLRFAQARALGLSVLTQRRLLLLDPAHTDLSKTSRAFAAELLAPADGISKHLSVLPEATGPALEAVAARFDVSALLVRHQYDNQIAR